MPKSCRWSLAAACLLLALVPHLAKAQSAASTEEQALEAIANARQERLNRAIPIELWAPLPSTSPGDRLKLVLNNAFGVELSAQVDLVDTAGRPLRLGVFKVLPSRHRLVDLTPALASDRFAKARSIRVTFPGDIEMFQSWLIRDGGGGTDETALRSGTATAARELAIFWDAAWLPGQGPAKPAISLLNTLSTPLEVIGAYPGATIPGFSRVLLPRQTFEVEVPRGLDQGILVLRHESAPGALLAFAALQQGSSRLHLPVSSDDASPEKNRYAAVRLPVQGAFFAAANLEADPVPATLSLYDPLTGGLLAVADREIAPNGVTTFAVGELLEKVGGATAASFVAARAETGPGKVLVAAGSRSAAGLPEDAPVFAEQMAHQNGSYPVLDTARFATVATLLNLGEEESSVGGQVLWDGGTYTVGPVRIPAGGAAEIDLTSRQLREKADRKGRPLPTELPNGYFQWTVLRGSHAILARTEARRLEGGDSVGFNCLGCCEEYSYGRIEPDGASFLPGQTPVLEANEYIASCGATLGPFQPYFALMTVPSPFTWDGDRVGAWQPAVNSVYFEGEGERIRPPSCEARVIRFGDGAPVQSIRVTIDEVSLPLDRIRITLSPVEASGLLTVTLRNPANKDLVYSQTYSGGSYTIPFSPLAAYSEGQEFSEVFVQWRASIGTSPPTTATATYAYRFKVLGTYLHTQYNSPIETLCQDPLVAPFCYQSAGCGGINCTSGSSASGRRIWLDETEENGSGVHSVLGMMSKEYYCGGGFCGSTRRYRQVPTPCGLCGSPLVAGQSVAISASNFYLKCGDQVFIPGLGTRTVVDTGGGVSTRQLDHYGGTGGCNDLPTLGYLPTFKLCNSTCNI